MSTADDDRLAVDDAPQPAREQGSKRFRFKESRKRHRDGDGIDSSGKRQHRHQHHHRHSSRPERRRRRTSSHLADDPSVHSTSQRNLPPDQAFRESLFDALGDDEGASFWEGVYGQPIHNYRNTFVDQETGQLETMDDEEYAQYVRRKMWEKSWEGIEASREEKRREREKEKQKMREDQQTRSTTEEVQDSFVFDFEVDASLRRGQQRKEKKRWQALWKDYLQRWADLQELAKNRTGSENDSEQVFLRNKIAWPVESGKRKDVVPDEIERFIKDGVANSDLHGDDAHDLLVAALKLERIRWHPDKIQQRYGFMQIDESVMQGVTAVFQVVDRMWSDLRKTASAE